MRWRRRAAGTPRSSAPSTGRAKTVKALLDALIQDFELREVRSLKSIKSHLKSVEDAFGHWKAVELAGDAGTSALNRYITDFDKAFKSACEEAGIPYGRTGGRTFHCFHRTAARNLRNAGVPENVCMAVTGHRTRAMFDRYSITSDHDIADAMTKLQAHVQAQPLESNVLPLVRKAAKA